jgi:acetolactate synthase-1/2/3 large subunit
MKKAADLFVEALENEGVKYIFGLPGEENLDFLNSLHKSKIKLILTRHEQGAGFMAATYGRLTGKPGVCLSTLGPGATNLMTPTAFAQLGGMPMVLITGQKPIKSSKQGLFQILDVVNMFEPITKLTNQVKNGSGIPALVRESFRTAIQERPGAVHIELPEDIAQEETDAQIFEVTEMLRPEAHKSAIARAAKMIEKAKMPLVMIGAGANRSRTCDALAEFIDRTGIPFFNTQMGKGVVNENHDLFLGTAALSSDDYIHYAIDKADLILNVGHDVIEKPPFFMEHGGKKVIHLNFSPAEIDRVYFPQNEVVGDIADSVRMLSKTIVKQDHWDFSFYRKVKEEVEKHITKYFDDTRYPLLPQKIVNEVRKAMPEDGIVTLDNGIYKIWFSRNYKAFKPNTLLLDNALATMGAGFPAAMAAKIVHPDRKVLAVCGDGGFMMTAQELETAVRLGLNITVLILNDNALGMIKWKQEDMGFENYGLDFSNPDFVKYAESFGAKGYRISDYENFVKTLTDCISSNKGVHIIDCPVDYSLNHEILNVRIKQKAAELE